METSPINKDEYIGQLEKSLEEKIFYLSTMRHDIGNANVKIGSIAMILQEYDDLNANERKEYLDSMVKGSKMISNIISNIRELELVENNLKTYPIQLYETLEKASNNAKNLHSLEEKQVKINLDDSLHIAIHGYTPIEAVFTNLIENSIKYGYSDKETEINIYCEEQDDMLKLVFEDNGHGIKDKKDIFDAGKRGEDHGQSGSGIGLNIVYKIVKSLEANITVENRVEEDYAQGTKFVIDGLKIVTDL